MICFTANKALQTNQFLKLKQQFSPTSVTHLIISSFFLIPSTLFSTQPVLPPCAYITFLAYKTSLIINLHSAIFNPHPPYLPPREIMVSHISHRSGTVVIIQWRIKPNVGLVHWEGLISFHEGDLSFRWTLITDSNIIITITTILHVWLCLSVTD